MDKQYFIPYKTGKEMLALKEDLFAAKKRILTAFPNLAQDYASRAAYSKYSKENSLCVLIPSDILDYGKTSKLIDKLPKNKNTDIYREYVFDVNGNILITNLVLKEKFPHEIYYIVDFEGYRYLINYPSEITDNDEVFCLKFDNGRLVSWENYSSVRGLYYCEFYYTIENHSYCTTELLHHKYESSTRLLSELEKESLIIQSKHESDSELLKELAREPIARLIESILNEEKEFESNIVLPVTDKCSPVILNIYELTYDSVNTLEQVDKINLTRGTKHTIYPRKSKKDSNIFKTRQCLKRLKDRLAGNGYLSSKNIPFVDFWVTFKTFALNDKFDCVDDSILWEPLTTSIHIARQFIHEKADGEYQGMEQLNIDFEIPRLERMKNTIVSPIWSDDDLLEFFEQVEQTDEFKSIDPNTTVELSMFFDKV